MNLPSPIKGYETLTDNTRELGEGVLLLATAQNARYREELPDTVAMITPEELVKAWDLEGLKVVGVTGTNGKTTVTALIYSLLIDLGQSCALQGTRGLFVDDRPIEAKHMTTPSILETLWNMKRAREAGAEYFVMEVSSHAIDQERIEGLEFALKVHTNVTRDHLDYHGSVEEYRRVKSRFFADEAPKLLNKDEIKTIRYNPVGAQTYGVEEPATFKVMAYSLSEGISAVITHHQEQATFFSNMMGLFNLYNLTAAVGAVHILTGEPLERICEAVEEFGGVKGRMEIVSYDPLIIVDFAHTPDGMQKVFESFGGKKIVALFGAGGDRDRAKRPLMGRVASRFCTKIYLTSDNPRSEDPKSIIEDIAEGIATDVEVHTILDRKEAIQKAIEELQEDETLLILGKGDEEYIETAEGMIPFSDVETAQEALKRKE